MLQNIDFSDLHKNKVMFQQIYSKIAQLNSAGLQAQICPVHELWSSNIKKHMGSVATVRSPRESIYDLRVCLSISFLLC